MAPVLSFFFFIKLAILFLSLDSFSPSLAVFILDTTFSNGANVFSLDPLSLVLMGLALHPTAVPSLVHGVCYSLVVGVESGGTRMKGTGAVA